MLLKELLIDPIEAMGYRVLVERGMKDLTFESVITKYHKEFNQEIVSLSKKRLNELESSLTN